MTARRRRDAERCACAPGPGCARPSPRRTLRAPEGGWSEGRGRAGSAVGLLGAHSDTGWSSNSLPVSRQREMRVEAMSGVQCVLTGFPQAHVCELEPELPVPRDASRRPEVGDLRSVTLSPGQVGVAQQLGRIRGPRRPAGCLPCVARGRRGFLLQCCVSGGEGMVGDDAGDRRQREDCEHEARLRHGRGAWRVVSWLAARRGEAAAEDDRHRSDTGELPVPVGSGVDEEGDVGGNDGRNEPAPARRTAERAVETAPRPAGRAREHPARRGSAGRSIGPGWSWNLADGDAAQSR